MESNDAAVAGAGAAVVAAAAVVIGAAAVAAAVCGVEAAASDSGVDVISVPSSTPFMPAEAPTSPGPAVSFAVAANAARFSFLAPSLFATDSSIDTSHAATAATVEI